MDPNNNHVTILRKISVKRTSRRELILFATVGVANTIFGYAVYAFCLYVAWPYQVASLLSMVASIFVGFIGQGRLVFKNSSSKRIVRYVLMWVGLLTVYNQVVKVAIECGYSPYIGGLMALPIVIPLSFFAQKYFVFRR